MHFTFYLGDSGRIGLNLQVSSDVKSGLRDGNFLPMSRSQFWMGNIAQECKQDATNCLSLSKVRGKQRNLPIHLNKGSC